MNIASKVASSHKPKSNFDMRQGFAYALPTVAVSFLMSPIAILQGVYAKYFGLPLMTIATVLLIARLFDAVTDPIIGYWSDRYYAHKHSRKPFVVAGGVLFVLSSYLLYVPVQLGGATTSTEVSTVYFFVCFLFFFLAWTLFEIPHLAWAGELAADYAKKNEIYTLRALCAYSGSLLFYIVPLLPFFDTTEFTPQTLKWSAVIAGLLMAPMLYYSIKTIPDKCCISLPINNRSRKPRLAVFSIIWRNKPLIGFIAAFVSAGIGIGMWFGVMFIFIDSYLGLGDKFALIYLLSTIAATMSLGGWYQLANRIGKKAAWSLSLLLMSIGIFCTGFLSPSGSNWLLLLLVMIPIISGYAAMAILAPSLLADISDYGMWKFGADHTATYFSLYTLSIKANAAIGGALSLSIAGYYKFDATAAHHSAGSVFGLILGGAWLPPLFVMGALVFVVFTPINARRHALILRRLKAKGKHGFENV